MAAPTINPLTSIPFYAQFAPLAYQPLADQSESLVGTVVAVDASADTIEITAHGLSNGQRVRGIATVGLPAPLSVAIFYFVVNATTNTFKVALTLGGAAINLTSTGSGTITFYRAFFWTATTLPPGVTINAFTGLVSGEAALAGVFNTKIFATNYLNETGELAFPIFIEPVSGVGAKDQTLCIEGVSGGVSRVGANGGLVGGSGVMLWLTAGDVHAVLMRFHVGGRFYTPDLESLKLTLKAFPDDAEILTAGGDTIDTDFRVFGAGTSGYAVTMVEVDSSAIADQLSSFAGDENSPPFFYCVGEIERQELTPYGLSPSTSVITSRKFVVQINTGFTAN